MMDYSPFAASFKNTVKSLMSPNNTGGYLSSASSYYEHPRLGKAAVEEYEPLKAKAEFASLNHETNSKAVMSALRGLKEKIRKLEQEREKADRNLKSLAVETSEYKHMLQKEQSFSDEKQTLIEAQNRDLGMQLRNVEGRCQLLEEQLTRMKEVSQSVGSYSPREISSKVHFRTDSKPGSAFVIHENSPMQLEKLADLEREHLKLSLSHTLTENKIRELQEKLKEEKHQRKLLQGKAAELQSIAESNRILLSLNSPLEQKVKPIAKRKKKVAKVKAKEPPPRKVANTSPVQDHYRLDFKKIPFVVGKSTSGSHSLGANVQNLLSMMKLHNPNLCKTKPNRTRQSPVNGAESSSDSSGSLTELLSALQDEFGRMGFEHSELVRTLHETEDVVERREIERTLQNLVSRMEEKGEQISLLKQHREKHRKEKRNVTKKNAEQKGVKGAQHYYSYPLKKGEVEVVTTVKSRTPNSPKLRTSRNTNLEKLHQVKKLQTSLQKDDLSWD